MVDKFENLAHEIIHDVVSTLMAMYPDIQIMQDDLDGKALIHGEAYYELENNIARKLRNLQEQTELRMQENFKLVPRTENGQKSS